MVHPQEDRDEQRDHVCLRGKKSMSTMWATRKTREKNIPASTAAAGGFTSRSLRVGRGTVAVEGGLLLSRGSIGLTISGSCTTSVGTAALWSDKQKVE